MSRIVVVTWVIGYPIMLHAFDFPPKGLLDRRNRENQNMKNQSRVQTCSNLIHFSEEQM